MAPKIYSSKILLELFFANLEKWPQNQIPSKLCTFHKLYRLEKFSRVFVAQERRVKDFQAQKMGKSWSGQLLFPVHIFSACFSV